jgi:serine/threonine protein kinase
MERLFMDTMQLCPSCGRPLAPSAPKGLCPECLLKAGFQTATQVEPGDPSQPPQPRFVPPQPEVLAPQFPQLEILELIGQGGMGAVYRARQPALDRLVALKILPPGAAGDSGFAERFTREARALAKLNHPNIVTVYEFGQTNGAGIPPAVGTSPASPPSSSPASGEPPAPPANTGFPYFLMEFVDGPNLRQVVRSGHLTPREALQIIPQICDALQFAHEEGIVHRYIKPENILLDRKGRVKIADFGIAKILGQPAEGPSLTGAKDVMGTAHYMAPEQVEKPGTVDHRADIYSLGVVLYELLTGELPLGKFAPPSEKVQVDVRLDDVVLRALQKEPGRRYQHASDLKTALDTIAAAPAVPPPSTVPPAVAPPQNISECRILPAFLLAFFFGVFGAHRFYVGKIGTGIMQLFTFGCCGIWTMVDWILLLCHAFTDKKGLRLTKWL